MVLYGEMRMVTKLNHKSSYPHIFKTDSSWTVFGFQWGGHYFCRNALIPFGWKFSYVYHTLNLWAMSFLKEHFISGSMYIDDRLVKGYKGPICYHE